MNSESATNSVATFLKLSRPIDLSPLHISTAVQTTHIMPVLANRNFQLAAFSTGLIGTGLALSAFYPGFFNGRHQRYNVMANDSFTPLHWLGEIQMSTHCSHQLTPLCRIPRQLCPARNGSLG